MIGDDEDDDAFNAMFRTKPCCNKICSLFFFFVLVEVGRIRSATADAAAFGLLGVCRPMKNDGRCRNGYCLGVTTEDAISSSSSSFHGFCACDGGVTTTSTTPAVVVTTFGSGSTSRSLLLLIIIDVIHHNLMAGLDVDVVDVFFGPNKGTNF